MAERFGRPPADPNQQPGTNAPVAPRYPDAEDDQAPPATRGSVAPMSGPGAERIDSQVQKAQEQLLNLRRQQELIEKQKRELEELSRRQDELEQGRTDMVEKLTRALVIVERQSAEAQKRVEQLRATNESFASHLQALEAINPKGWPSADLQRELNRALGMVDHARTEYSQQKGRLVTEAADGAVDPDGDAARDRYDELFGGGTDHNFLFFLKAGVAFTLPLVLVLLFLALILCWKLVNSTL